jgi:hypothetical protein
MRHDSPQMRHDSPQMRHDSPHMRHDSPHMRHDSPHMRHDSPRGNAPQPVQTSRYSLRMSPPHEAPALRPTTGKPTSPPQLTTKPVAADPARRQLLQQCRPISTLLHVSLNTCMYTSKWQVVSPPLSHPSPGLSETPSFLCMNFVKQPPRLTDTLRPSIPARQTPVRPCEMMPRPRRGVPGSPGGGASIFYTPMATALLFLAPAPTRGARLRMIHPLPRLATACTHAPGRLHTRCAAHSPALTLRA